MTKFPRTTVVKATVLKVTVLLAALALIASACGGGDSSTETAETTAATTEAPTTTEAPATTSAEPAATTEPAPTTEPVPLTASFRGVTPTEIHIGVSMLDFGALAEFNLVTEGWGDQIQVYQSFIDDLNSRGGINGRMLVPHYELYSPLGSTEAEAACVALTADIETFAVLGGFLGPAEVANGCIVDINDTVLVGGRQTAERLAQAKAPWLDTPAQRERRLSVFLELLDQDGRLAGANVAVIGSIEQEDIYNSAGDVFAAKGVEPVLEALNDVPQGESVAADARWQVLAENIRASGADTVLLIGSTQAGVRGVSTNGLDVEVWVLESTGLENLGADTTPADAHGAITITGLTDQQAWNHESVADCRAIFAAAHPEVTLMDPDEHEDGDEKWFKSIHLYCRLLRIFELVATEAGPDLTQDSFAAAADRIGEISLPAVPFASFGPGKPDASDSFQLAQFDQNEGENGALLSISELLDGTP